MFASLLGGGSSRIAAPVGRRGTTQRFPDYITELDIQILAAEQARQSVAGRMLGWQAKTPQYPTVTYGRTVRQGFRGNPVVRSCTDYLSTSVAQGTPSVVERDTGAPVIAGRPAEMLAMLARGGRVKRAPGMTWRSLLKSFDLDLSLYGNAYFEMVRSASGRVVEIWRLDPRYVAVELDEREWISRYLYQAGGQWWPIPAADIVHVMAPDPEQPYFGLPPLYSAWRELSVDNSLTDHQQVTLQNLAVPPVVLEADGEKIEVSEAQAEEARKVWKRRYGGRNRGDVAVLPSGIKAKVLGMNFRDMAIGEVIATSESRIAMVFHVPMILLGRSGTQADPTRANYREAKTHFWEDTVIPRQQDIAEALTCALLPEFLDRPSQDGQLEFRFDVSSITVLQEARLDRGAKASEIFKAGLASRGAAQRMAGMRLHGPDVFYRPGSVEAVVPGNATEESIELDQQI